MDNREAVNWLANVLADIGKAEHNDLWHYEQALTEIKDMLESAQPVATDTNVGDTISRQAAIDAIYGITAYKGTIPLGSAIFNINKIPAAQPAPDQNGDLWITVPDIDEVTCIYVQESKSKFCRIFYEER